MLAVAIVYQGLDKRLALGVINLTGNRTWRIVFGFVGIETIGYRVKLSSDEFHYHEVWTYLYALFLTVALIEWWGAKIRQSLNTNLN